VAYSDGFPCIERTRQTGCALKAALVKKGFFMKVYVTLFGCIFVLVVLVFFTHFSWQKKYERLSGEMDTAITALEAENEEIREKLSTYCARITRLEKSFEAAKAKQDCPSEDTGESEVGQDSDEIGESKVSDPQDGDTFKIVDDDG
jgi:hypothetical protein